MTSSTHFRRIDRLKAQAYELGFSNADAKEFGKLSKTATWESLLNFYDIDTTDKRIVNIPSTSVDTRDWTNDGTFPVCNFDARITTAASFLSWVDPLQLLACFLVSIGLFVLLLSVIPNPFKFVPSCVRINIQIGEQK
ncbi:MAG: hypothetical protein ACRC62_27610 [Microcoleus sp.]